MADEREELRATFDSVAERYHDARPDYPDELFETLIEVTGARPGDRVLEVGYGTGKATLPLARRGFAVTGVELGPALAAVARRHLRDHPGVRVECAAFESWPPAPADPTDGYHLVVSATAWHWLDPTIRYRRAGELLRPGGQLAFWSAEHVFPDGGDPFFHEIQDVYDEIGESLPPGAPRARPGGLPDQRAEIERSGLFEVVAVRHLDWETTYDADGYLALLDTFSGHIAMPDGQRRRLYSEIRHRLAARPDCRLRRHWGAVLHVARAIPATRAGRP